MKTAMGAAALVWSWPSVRRGGGRALPGRPGPHRRPRRTSSRRAKPVLRRARAPERDGRERLRRRPLRPAATRRRRPSTSWRGGWRARAGGRLPWIAALDDGAFEEPGLRRAAPSPTSIAPSPEGARGVKIYKSMGMELRRPDGRYVLPDDPVFAPMFAGLAQRERHRLRPPGRAHRGLAAARSAEPRLRLLQEQPGLVRARPRRRPVQGGDPRRPRPRAREASAPARRRLPPREHGRGRRRHRAAPGPLSELRGRHRGARRAPHAASRARRCASS